MLPISEVVRPLLEGPQASPVYLSVKNSNKDEDGCGDLLDICMQVKTERLGEMFVPVSLCLQQVPHRLA